MMLVDKETGKGYVEMEKVHRDKKEYASKAVGGTALGLSIGALGLQLLGGGLLNCGLFGNRATVAETAAIIEEANKELELFKKFQIAAQANPKLTYVDFCNNIKNKEV